ncbi:MAG TPA: inorganic phosphate transporter [Candidatus Hydrogenedens sp.]|nr:inorganic phosphate transporter [Candidatus Hydrogenedens sp.]
MLWLTLATAGFLGLALGANDAGNVFGTAVATRFIRFRTAGIVTFIFVVIGAVLQGSKGIDTLSGITNQTVNTSILIGLVVAFVSFILTILGQPISLSQAVVGGILGLGLAQNNVQWHILEKVIICWIFTPLGSGFIAIVCYKLLFLIFAKIKVGILTRETIVRYGLLISGIMGAYALGANNVANTVGMFAGSWENISNTELSLLGGLFIGIGVILFSKSVMMSIGKGIVLLDGFSALVVVLSSGITVFIFSIIGVPVSSTQAVVGAIIGVGIHHGVHTLHPRMIKDIFLSWIIAPLSCLILTSSGYVIFIT